MEYPNTGAIFKSNYKTKEAHADMTGNMKFEKEFLQQLIDATSDGEPVVLKLDAWVRRDKNENRMVTLKANTYVKPVATQQKDPWDD
jgi:hypothetical protein